MYLKIYMNYSDLIKNKDFFMKDIFNSLYLVFFLLMSINNFIFEKVFKFIIFFYIYILEVRVE